jgi:cell division protein FtsB
MRSAFTAGPRRSFTGRRVLAVLAAAICGWAAYTLYGAAAQDRALAAGVSRLQSENAALASQIAERSMQIAEATSPAWIEEQARKLGFHLPGETIYVVVPSGASVPASGGVDATPPSFSPTPTPSPTPAPAGATPAGSAPNLVPSTPSP